LKLGAQATFLGAQCKSCCGQSWGWGFAEGRGFAEGSGFAEGRGFGAIWYILGRGLGGVPLLSVEIFLETLMSLKFLESSIQ